MRGHILTVTLNPAIDRIIHPDRASMGTFFAGGKGINVARAARCCGVHVKAVGIEGGVTGWMLQELLSREGIRHDLFIARGDTRVNTTRIAPDGRVARTIEPGHALTRAEQKAFEVFLARKVRGYGVVVFSGSLPPRFPVKKFVRLVGMARQAGAFVAVDTGVAALEAALKSGVDLIKPNRAEAEGLLGFRLSSRASIRKALHTFLGYGIKKVIISLGSAGLAAADHDQAVLVRVPPVKGAHTVGCGDSALAGFLVAMMGGKDLGACARYAAACGTANMLSLMPGEIARENIIKLERKVRLEKE